MTAAAPAVAGFSPSGEVACRVDCSCGASLWGGVPQVSQVLRQRHRWHRIVAVDTLTLAQLVDQAALERAVARRLHMQEAALLLHSNRPQIVRAAR